MRAACGVVLTHRRSVIMHVATVCSRNVVSCPGQESLRRLAELMRSHHVGAIVVTSGGTHDRRPIGIVTDRDIVVEVVATGLDAEAITAADVIRAPVVVVNEQDSLLDAVHRMRSRGVRRLPVTDARGNLAGIVSFDDVLHALTHELSTLVRVAEHQPSQESRTRP
jgi:CBS domain-containing protein